MRGSQGMPGHRSATGRGAGTGNVAADVTPEMLWTKAYQSAIVRLFRDGKFKLIPKDPEDRDLEVREHGRELGYNEGDEKRYGILYVLNPDNACHLSIADAQEVIDTETARIISTGDYISDAEQGQFWRDYSQQYTDARNGAAVRRWLEEVVSPGGALAGSSGQEDGFASRIVIAQRTQRGGRGGR